MMRRAGTNISQRTVVPIFISHQGCPHRCIYCNQFLTGGSPEEQVGDDAAAALAAAYATYGGSSRPREIAFYGGTFTALPPRRQRRYLDAAQSLVNRGLAAAVRVSTRPDAIDPAALLLLKGYAVETVELGAQSLVDSVLAASRRGYRASEVVRSAEMVRESGFKLGLQLMPGLPGDTPESMMLTARRAVAMAPDMVRLYPTLVLRDTPLAQLYLKGEYRPFSLEEMVEICRELYLVFAAAGIDVIRMGLHPTESMRSEGAILAGPFHPSFGHLVYTAVLRQRAGRLLKDRPKTSGPLIFKVARGQTSTFLGLRKENIAHLQKQYKFSDYRVVEDDGLARTEVQLG